MVEWSQTVFLFPGQNSQEVGMGQWLAAAYPVAKQTFDEADAILGFHLSKLCFDGPDDALNDTINTQPAVFVCSIATLRALQQELPQAVAAFVAGHSLGELTALVAAGAMSFEDGLRLVRERGRLMKQAGEQTPGAMAAILGLDADIVRDVCSLACQQTGGQLVLANDNCPGQLVISGDEVTLEAGLVLAKESGAKRAIKLAVSIAAHSPLMGTISAEFQDALAKVSFQNPQMPVYGNVNAAPLTSVEAIREELNGQLTQTVRWTEAVLAMIVAGAERFIEVGSKDVLTGLLKRIDRSKQGINLNTAEAWQTFINEQK